jgi:hypothetical protein
VAERNAIVGAGPASQFGDVGPLVDRVRQQFRGLQDLPFDVQTGTGPGFAEVFPQEESRSPNPGVDTIQLRRPELSDREQEAVILGEAMHFLPLRNRQFNDLKQEFVRKMRPEQLNVVRRMHEENKVRNNDPRSFDEFNQQSGADAFIRDFVFQSTGTVPGGKGFVSGVGPIGGAFFKEQIPVLRQIVEFLNKGPRTGVQ